MKKVGMMTIALLLTIVAGAQTLNVQVGDVTYQFPAAQTGDMTYSNGTTLTIMDKEFAISDITGMVVDKSEVADNQVTVSYNGTTAKVTVAGNVAQYLTPVVSGAHVSIAQSDLTISGGYVFSKSSGNDGIDANGNCYIKGGLVYAIGTTAPEKSIDANTEEGKKLYITGGSIIAVGDLENGVSISGGTCKSASSWTANTWHALYNGGTLVAAFKTPASSGNSGGGPGGWPGGGGPGGGPGGGSQKLIVYTSSTPTVKSGVTVADGTEYFGGMANIGGTVSGGSDVTLSNYSSGGGWW